MGKNYAMKREREGHGYYGGESEDDMGLWIQPRLSVVREYKSAPKVSGLLDYIIDKEGPKIVMPDGNIIIPEDGSARGEFNDSVARVFAEQNKGIYFPSASKRGEIGFSFSDFLEAERRRSLLTKEDLEKIASDGFEKISQESRFFSSDVYSFVEGDRSGVYGRLDGKVFGKKDSGKGTFLYLGLDGFGYEHMGVSSKKLFTSIFMERLSEDSPERMAINEYIKGISKELANKESEVFLYWNWNENGTLVLEMNSPNSCDHKSVRDTEDMAGLYLPLVDRLCEAREKIEHLSEEKKKESVSKAARELDL